MRFRRQPSDFDPLDEATKPPPGESKADKSSRLKKEEEARKTSQVIDEEIRVAKQERFRLVRDESFRFEVVIAGVKGSGKSTVMKQFQRAYDEKPFEDEILTYQYILCINLIQSARKLIRETCFPNVHSESKQKFSNFLEKPPVNIAKYLAAQPFPLFEPSDDAAGRYDLYEEIMSILSPFFELENKLLSYLEFPSRQASDLECVLGEEELTINNHYDWERLLDQNSIKECLPSSKQLAELLPLVQQFWHTRVDKKTLKSMRPSLYFEFKTYLATVTEMLNPSYLPSHDQILRAHVRHTWPNQAVFPAGLTGYSCDGFWTVTKIDCKRSTNYGVLDPFLDSLDVAIFLVPISDFDEGPLLSRLHETIILWESVVAGDCVWRPRGILLMFNKCDILKEKLKLGIQIKDYYPDYGTRANDFTTACSFFKELFMNIYKTHEVRNAFCKLHVHFVSMCDLRIDMKKILEQLDVHAALLRGVGGGVL